MGLFTSCTIDISHAHFPFKRLTWLLNRLHISKFSGYHYKTEKSYKFFLNHEKPVEKLNLKKVLENVF